MKGSGLAGPNNTAFTGTTTADITPTTTSSTLERAKTATSTSAIHSISLPREHFRPRTRPGHPVSLISFPATSGNKPTRNTINSSNSTSTNSNSKVPGPISTRGWRQEARELLGGPEEEEEERWISQGAKFFRVPKPSQSAKKLAKPTTIYLPVNAMTERSVRSGVPFLPSAYAKLGRRARNPYNVYDFFGESSYKGENSPSGSSNNIDNKIGNKPRRNKTATPAVPPGLRKGLATPKSRLSRNASRLLVGESGRKVIVNSTKSASTSSTPAMTLSSTSEGQQQQDQSCPFGGDDDLNIRPRQMANVLTSGSSGNGVRPPVAIGASLPTNKLNEKFQVNRSPEERDQSPESIHLDGMGLKAFPLIGGGEGPCLKLLSLQRNLITRLENVPAQLNHLVVLDLYDNRLERITGLQGLTSLRVLLLGKNRIRRIEGLEGLKRLEILDLHGNQLRYVDNLGSLSSLRVLNLAGNLLRSIRNLGPYGLPSLTELNLKRNRIRNLEGLQKAPHLKKLLLANNDLQSFGSLFPLRKLVFLQEVLLHPNPLCAVAEYTSQVLTVFPWLATLDRCTLTDQMRVEAKLWHQRKLAEDEERRKEETRLRLGSPTGGPPGSREQTIYQARRRWQSVKNFVKNTPSSKPTNPSSSTLRSEESEIPETLPLSQAFPDLVGEYQRESMTGLEGQGNLDLDLDSREEECTMVSSCNNNNDGSGLSSSVVPGDPCPPLMINDLKPTHREDYVNTNLPLPSPPSLPVTQGRSSSRPLLLLPLLSSQSRQMDSAITNIRREAGGSPSLRCQQPGDDQLLLEKGLERLGERRDLSNHPNRSESKPSSHALLQKDEDEKESGSSVPTSGGFGESKSMRIAVVRPVVRETNLNETIPSPPLNTNSSGPSTNKIFSQPSPSTSDNNTTNHSPPTQELKKSSHHHNYYQSNHDEDLQIKRVNPEEENGASPRNDLCAQITNQKEETPKSPIAFQKEMNHPPANNNTPSANPIMKELPTDTILPPSKNDPYSTTTNNIIPDADATLPIPDADLDKANSAQSKTFSTASSMISKTSNADSSNIKNSPATTTSTSNSNSGSVNISSKRNLLRRSMSTLCLPPKDSTQVLETCPTFEQDDASVSTTYTKGSGRGGGGCDSEATNVPNVRRKPDLRNLRSASFDGRLPSSPRAESDDDYYYDDDDDDTCSIATSTNTTATTSDVSPRTNTSKPGFLRRQLFPRTRSQRLKFRDRTPRIQSSSSVTSRKSGPSTGAGSSSGARVDTTRSNRQLRRCDSAIVGSTGGPLENLHNPSTATPLKKQGTDYLVEIDGKVLSIYGQGALKHTLTGFGGTATCSVTTAKFHYISYDSIIPYFGKLRQIYSSLEHFQFRANNICMVSQLNALSDLQGLTSLHISKEGNPLVSQDCWVHYASYRLAHWGLCNVNQKEVCSEYRGGQGPSSKCFESLGFLALSCLPQTALTPLAKRLHMLHCFCCCSPSSSSEESGKGRGNNTKGPNARPGSPTEQPLSSSGNICTSWDDDPVLLDVIGKEALVYCPPPGRRLLSPTPPILESSELQKVSSDKKHSDINDGRRRETLRGIVNSGVEILEKLDMLEKTWPSLMTEIVQDILMDYMFMDNYMKKELKKCQDTATIALHSGKKSSHHHH